MQSTPLTVNESFSNIEYKNKELWIKYLLEDIETNNTQKIADLVIGLEAFEKSDKVLLYAPIRGEVETEKIYRSARLLSKDVYYPRVQGIEMEFYLVNEKLKWKMSNGNDIIMRRSMLSTCSSKFSLRQISLNGL